MPITLTINGIDGFKSGKWNIHPNARVIDDETLELNATGAFQGSTVDFPVLPNMTYTLSTAAETTGTYWVKQYDGAGGLISTLLSNVKSGTVTTANNAYKLRVEASNGSTGKFTFKRPMLNMGSVPAPYEKKKGEKMVMPVARKNLFDGILELGSLDTVNGSNVAIQTAVRTVNFISVRPNTNYVLSNSLNVSDVNFYFYDSNKNFISFLKANNCLTPINAYYVKFRLSGANLENKIQLEEGTTPTPYEPYAVQVNKKPLRPLTKAKTGLVMDGVSNYVQLPSMTMDSIEIECLIETINGTNFVLMDARNGLSNGFVYTTGTSGSSLTVDKTPVLNTRQKIKITANASFTDDVTIFANMLGSGKVKGTLYKVTCYLAGQIVAQYDFENPSNIVGDKVLPNAKNLIPSFEDSRWSLHSNFRVLGKDVGRLDATGTYQISKLTVSVKNGLTHTLTSELNGEIEIFQNTTRLAVIRPNIKTAIFTPTTDTVEIRVHNGNTTSGSFDFVKPSLYELTSKEGTIIGKPVQLMKAPKRQLYAKR